MFARLAVALPLLAASPLPPAPSRYVTDAANAIPDDREAALNEKLAQHDRETTNQVLVYVDRRVPAGTTLEEMGAEAIRTWAVGDAKKDNGAILFFFIDDRESRIEVGYGLEGVLTDAHSKRILVGLRPALRSADYATAAEQGVDAIVGTIAGRPAPPASQPEPIHGTDGTNEGLVFGFILLIAGIIIGFIFIRAIRKVASMGAGVSSGVDWPPAPSSSSESSTSSWSDSWSDSSSSSSSSSDSSSGFSGGGGSGGGGGASDKW